jgi:hypothetical protein
MNDALPPFANYEKLVNHQTTGVSAKYLGISSFAKHPGSDCALIFKVLNKMITGYGMVWYGMVLYGIL